VNFRFRRLRLVFLTRTAMQFTPGNPANILRGALGLELQKRDPALYARVFRPCAAPPPTREQQVYRMPSGFLAPPLPFVFRAGHLNGKLLEPGESFNFDLHLFDTRPELCADLACAFEVIGREGIGPGRGRAELVQCTSEQMHLALIPSRDDISAISVRFLTPTELKAGNGVAPRPEFSVLFARVRDRISALSALYQENPLDLDFKGMGERACGISMSRCEVQNVAVLRRSSRTGQVHPLSGFVGESHYAGTLSEFVPFLEAAQFTGVGRQTVWGKGEIQISF